jgi:hypothetical protein
MSTTPGDDGREPSTWAPVGSPPPYEGQQTPSAPTTGAPQGWGAPVPPPPGGYPPSPAPGYPPAPPNYPGGWRPPVLQPGIVPLRPLGLGEILDGAVRAIRANPAVMFGLSAAAVAIAVVLQALVQVAVAPTISAQISDWLEGSTFGSAMGSETGTISDLYGSSFGQLASLPLTQLVITILTGLLIVSVSKSVLGEKITVGDVVRNSRVWWVLGFTLLAGFVSLLATGAVVALAVLLVQAQSWGALAASLLILVPVLVVATVWFTIRTMLVPPALMLEGRGFWFTVARAWRLTRGSFWRLLGISLLVSIMVGFASSAVQVPVSVIAQLVTGDAAGMSVASVAINSVGEAITLTLTTTYQAAVTALLYIDVRMRREGLDLELGQAAAARTA